MGRSSAERTNISQLRITLGINQGAFAKLLGRSLTAVQSLETGRLKLSKQLAGEISTRTGVNPRWLLDGNREEAPYDMSGKPWSAETYKKLLTEVPHHLKDNDEVFRQRMLEVGTQLSQARNLAGLRRIYRSLSNGGQALEVGRKVDQFLARIMLDMNIQPDVNMMEEVRYAEHEASRKSQNVLRVAGIKEQPAPIPAKGEPTPAEAHLRSRSERIVGSALVGAAWRK